jgi:chemotaxis protein CheD
VNLVTRDAEIVVPMAGIGIGKDQAILRTLLGSCIGVALYDSRLRLAGLAHVVMPESNGNRTLLGKYADTAIPETILRLQALAGAGKLDLVAKIAGGANMFAGKPNSPTGIGAIGQQNQEAVEGLLRKLRIPVLARELGGTAGRKMVLYARTGLVQIQVLGQTTVEV